MGSDARRCARLVAAYARRRGSLVLLGMALAVALLLWRVRPLASGRAYGLGLELTAVLFGLWLAWTVRHTLFRSRPVLAVVAAVGIVGGALRAAALDPGAEVLRTYTSLFQALANGRNPYTCQCIVHSTPVGDRLGNFNYPPFEIWPYQGIRWIAGHWDVGVLAFGDLALNAVAFGLLVGATPRGRRLWLLPALPFVVLWELRTTIGTTMVVVAAIVAVLLARTRHERRWHRPVTWVLFGVGLLTKFAVIPLFMVWWWSTTVARLRATDSTSRVGRLQVLRASAADALVPVAIALILCIPFGLRSVVRDTLLFNTELHQRAELTTFYPNVVSGLMSWAQLERIYPLVAVALVVGAVLLAARLPLLTGMLVVTTVFLLASPTPEPQYLPLVVLLLLAALTSRGLEHPEPLLAAP